MEQEERKELLSQVEGIIRKYVIVGAGAVDAFVLIVALCLAYMSPARPSAEAAVTAQTVMAAPAAEVPVEADTAAAVLPDPLEAAPQEKPAADAVDDIFGDLLSGETAAAPKEKPLAERKAEAQGRVEEFQRTFFNVNPDPAALQASMKKALAMVSDDSAADYYKGLRERNYFEKLRNLKATQRLDIMAVTVNTGNEPWTATTTGTLTVVRPDGETVYDYSGSCGVACEDGTYMIRDVKAQFNKK